MTTECVNTFGIFYSLYLFKFYYLLFIKNIISRPKNPLKVYLKWGQLRWIFY